MAIKKLSARMVFVVYILFLLIWVFRVYLLNGIIAENLNVIETALVNASIKLILWCIPAVVLIQIFKKDLTISLREMFTTKVSIKIFLPVFIVLSIWSVATAIFLYGKISISPNFKPSDLIGMFLIVGITEELLFRGWFLNALLTVIRFRYANIIVQYSKKLFKYLTKGRYNEKSRYWRNPFLNWYIRCSGGIYCYG